MTDDLVERAARALAEYDYGFTDTDTLILARAALSAAYQWQPIETAPKDGADVLFVGRWRPYPPAKGGEPCYAIACWSSFSSSSPVGTHWISGMTTLDQWNVDWISWMPLPAPPMEG